MNAVMGTLSGINWAAWSFVALIGGAVVYMARVDRNPNTQFKLYHFISDKEGGNSASLAYTGIFLVGTWLVWFLAINKQWGEAVTLVGSLGAIFVTGGVVRHLTGSRERVGIVKAQQPKGDMPPVKTTTTTQTDTSVTQE